MYAKDFIFHSRKISPSPCIQSISQTSRLAECFSTSMICSMAAVKGYDTETGDSVDSSNAPVIRPGLNQLELLTGIRIYQLSEYCHTVILKIILSAKSDPRQTTKTLTKFSTIASNLLLFVLATLKRTFLLDVM